MAVDVPPNKFELLIMESEKEGKRQARHEKSRARDDWIVNVGLPRMFKYFFLIAILLSFVMVLTGNEDGF